MREILRAGVAGDLSRGALLARGASLRTAHAEHAVSSARYAGLVLVIITIMATAMAAAFLMPQPEVAEAAATVTLEYWHPYGSPWDKQMEATADAFMKDYPNIKVIVRSVPDLHQKLLVAVATGKAPDVAHVWLFGFGDVGNIFSFASKGALEPLDPLLNQLPQWNRQDVFPGALQQFEFDGHLWGLPFAAQPMSLVWNQQVFDEAGVAPLKGRVSQETFDTYVKKLTRRNGDTLERVGILPFPDMWGRFFNLAYHFGGEFYDAATHKITASQRANVEALNWLVGLYDLYGGVAAVEAWKQDALYPGNRPLYSGKAAMAFWSHYNYYQAHVDNPKFAYGFTLMPDLGSTSVELRGEAVHADAQVVLKGTKHPKEAALFAWYSSLGPGFLKGWLARTGHPSASASLDRQAMTEGLLPSWYPKSLWQQNFIALQRARPWPRLPILQQLMTALDNAVLDAVNKRKSPEGALQTVDQALQPVLNRALQGS